MTEQTAPQGEGTTAAPDTNVLINVPHSALGEGQPDRSITLDAAGIPAEARLALLKSQISTVVLNRVNVANVRRNKERAPFLAWAAYKAAVAADPMQTAVAKPEGDEPTGECPAPLDTYAKAEEAIADLLKGELRTAKPKGEGRKREAKDPLIVAITGVVVRALYDAKKDTKISDGKGGERKYSYPDATKEVGGDGLAYINTQIDAKVAAGADRTQLEKARDERYVNPAKIMLGQGLSKKQQELPSIL